MYIPYLKRKIFFSNVPQNICRNFRSLIHEHWWIALVVVLISIERSSSITMDWQYLSICRTHLFARKFMTRMKLIGTTFLTVFVLIEGELSTVISHYGPRYNKTCPVLSRFSFFFWYSILHKDTDKQGQVIHPAIEFPNPSHIHVIEIPN